MAKELEEVMEGVRQDSDRIKVIVDDLVGRYSAELDEFIQIVSGVLTRIKRGDLTDYPDSALELQAIRLPVLIYFASGGLEYLGAESDIARAKYMEEYNRVLLQVKGTIPEKEAKAESASYTEDLVADIYQRAYKTLKVKLEAADKIFSALKKVLTKRISEIELSRMEPRGVEKGEDRPPWEE